MLVENEEVSADGGAVLAFIDTCEERGMRWAISWNIDGHYKVDVLVEGHVISAEGASLGEAIHNLGKEMVSIGMRGAASA
jgi:hypothetical protein